MQTAAQDSAERLYPRFAEADDPRWGTVIKRAGDGAGDALTALGYTGDAEKHAVCQRVLAFVGGGKRGSEVQKHFEGPPYGWPREAVNGALLVLLVNGHLTARQNTVEVTAKQLTLTKIGVTDFRAETVMISAQQRIDLRGLLQRAGIPVQRDEEGEGVARLIDQLVELAAQAGGDPPLPERPSVAYLVELQAAAGNERLLAVWEQRDIVESQYREWRARAELIAAKLPRWEQLHCLLAHAGLLSVASDVESELRAVSDQRLLLHEPDLVPPLIARVSEALREAVRGAAGGFTTAIGLARQRLAATEAWAKLDEGKRLEIIQSHQLNLVEPPDLSTDKALLCSLDDSPLRVWPDRIAAVDVRLQAAMLAAAKAVEPTIRLLSLPSRTLRVEADVHEYVEEVRGLLLAGLADGPVVIG